MKSCFTLKSFVVLLGYNGIIQLNGCDGLSMQNDGMHQRPLRIAVVGGGASGMFAATNAASTLNKHSTSKICEVHVYEATSKLMSKVSISGGGRCNVLHDTTKPLDKILSSYPRGSRELNGLYSKYFTPDTAKKWFTDRGVVLKTESDGRMFPVTDNSQTIIDCIYDDAKKNGVIIKKGKKVASLDKDDTSGVGFNIITQNRNDDDDDNDDNDDADNFYDCIIMATGSSPRGHDLIKNLDVGHTIVDPVPSLFTLNAAQSQIKDHNGILNDLSGLSVQHARLSLKVSGKYLLYNMMINDFIFLYSWFESLTWMYGFE